jgi:hypothetical protein
MHPQFHIDMLHRRSQELAERLELARLLAGARPAQNTAEAASLRLSHTSDDPAIEQLAALEGRTRTRGRHLLAEVGGEIVAALPIAGGEPVADPFRRTAHLLPMMRSRAAQLSETRRPHLAATRALAARVLHSAG